MRKISKLLVLLLAAVMIISLFGCSANNAVEPIADPAEPSVNTEEPAVNTEVPEKEPTVIFEEPAEEPEEEPEVYTVVQENATLLYQGHASLRITTREGKVIYIDPYAGVGYDVPADLILITHGHDDHARATKIETKNDKCKTIVSYVDAIIDEVRQTLDFGYVTVEAVEAKNANHSPKTAVGYILTFSDGVQVYISGDTDQTEQMATFAERGLDYAFFCADGVYNMSAEAAADCAELVGAHNNIPYHLELGKLYNDEISAKFDAPNTLIVKPDEEIILERG